MTKNLIFVVANSLRPATVREAERNLNKFLAGSQKIQYDRVS